MAEELDILKIIADNPEISQRKIAEQTGISLGQVNFLIKKCAKKGFIKIEGQTTKSIKYNLTPKGLSQKAVLTLEYIQISYAAVINLTNKIKSQVQQYQEKYHLTYVYGSNDELMEICKLALGTTTVEYISPSETLPVFETNGVVFYWEEQWKTILESTGVKAVNILL